MVSTKNRDSKRNKHFRQTTLKDIFIVTWSILNVIPNTQSLTTTLSGRDYLKKILREYINPRMPGSKKEWPPVFRGSNEDEMMTFIKDKITVSKPKRKVLENKIPKKDNSFAVDEKQSELEEKNDTAIIEFVPNLRTKHKPIDLLEERDPLKKHINDFKMLRAKIKKVLRREYVSNKTMILVLRTIDDMIIQMKEHQCQLKSSGLLNSIHFKTNSNDQKGPLGLASTWNRMWDKLKQQYLKTETGTATESTPFLNKFQNLVTRMTNDLQSLTDKYKIVCEMRSDNPAFQFLPNKKRTNSNEQGGDKVGVETADVNKNDKDRQSCEDLKVCPEELAEFLIEFFLNLNETATATVWNYREMFMRDVNDDANNEKQRIINLITEINRRFEDNILKTYMKYTERLVFKTRRNPEYNIMSIRSYMSKIIETIKKFLHTEISKTLTSVKQKLMNTIRKDIEVNLNVDLKNLERDMNLKMCSTFQTCGNVSIFRKATNDAGNSVSLKLELDQENETQEKFGGKTYWKMLKGRSATDDTMEYKQFRIDMNRDALEVTRTTPNEGSELITSTSRKKKRRRRKLILQSTEVESEEDGNSSKDKEKQYIKERKSVILENGSREALIEKINNLLADDTKNSSIVIIPDGQKVTNGYKILLKSNVKSDTKSSKKIVDKITKNNSSKPPKVTKVSNSNNQKNNSSKVTKVSKLNNQKNNSSKVTKVSKLNNQKNNTTTKANKVSNLRKNNSVTKRGLLLEIS